jgi:hypothetical protein
MLKDRITELKAIWDQARADTERTEGAINRQGPPITAGLSRSPVRAQARLSRSFPLVPTTSMALCNAAEIREATAYW